MKTLKFRESLSKLILQKEKTTTWRLFDDKNLSQGDIISLIIWETGEEFGKAKIIDLIEKEMKDLSEEDWEGHEKFNSNEEMYQTYSKYYNKEVTTKTKIKIIKFERF